MRFSIVTICFNAEKCISKTIESVLSQQVHELEYIIVDGLSLDNTIGVAKKYEQAFIDKGWSFRIISEKDNGIYDAMNKGVKNSTGDIVGILNSGDWYESIALQKVEECFLKNHIDFCYSDIFVVKQNGKRIVKKAKKMKYLTSRHWNHPTMFVKKKIYDEFGLSEDEFNQQMDLIKQYKAGNASALEGTG